MGSIIEYPGKRGTTFRLKYTDASGKRVLETLPRGTTAKGAKEALRDRESDVSRIGYRRPDKMTFGQFASEWLEPYIERKQVKTATARGYRTVVSKHLVPAFGKLQLQSVDVEVIERQTAKWLRDGLSPRTVNANLQVLGMIFKAARKRKLIMTNPVDDVDRPKQDEREWRILTPVEDFRRDNLTTARAMFQTVMILGLRCGELLGLRWRSVALADPDGPRLRVAETWTRNRVDTPKSKDSRRTLAFNNDLAGILMDHRAWSAFDSDSDRVFPNPRTGNAYDIHTYGELWREVLKRAGITDYLRPFHDGRHAAITNMAMTSRNSHSVQARAGHSSSQVTQRYIHLAGQLFRDDAEAAEARQLGVKQETAA